MIHSHRKWSKFLSCVTTQVLMHNVNKKPECLLCVSLKIASNSRQRCVFVVCSFTANTYQTLRFSLLFFLCPLCTFMKCNFPSVSISVHKQPRVGPSNPHTAATHCFTRMSTKINPPPEIFCRKVHLFTWFLFPKRASSQQVSSDRILIMPLIKTPDKVVQDN